MRRIFCGAWLALADDVVTTAWQCASLVSQIGAMQEHPRQKFEIGLSATSGEEVRKVGIQIAKVVSPRSPAVWNTFAVTRLLKDELDICGKEVAEHFLVNFRLTVTRDEINLERTTPLGKWKEVFVLPNETRIV